MPPRVVNGMHISNERHWFVEDQIASAKATGAVTILHHLLVPRDTLADQWGDPENEYWFVKLRDGWEPQGIPPAPERLIHVRLYHPNWTVLDPKKWAEHAVRLLERVVSGGKLYNLWDDPYVCISAANEQNLHNECGDSSPLNQWQYRTRRHYEAVARWNLTFWKTVDQLIPGRRALSCWSAFAQGHDPDEADVPDGEYQIPAVREAVEYCDLLGTHPYGHLNWPDGQRTVPGGEEQYWHMLRDFRPEGYRDAREPGKPHDPGGSLAQFPGKPTLFSECGTFSHADRARTSTTLLAMERLLARAAASGQVVGCTWFIGNSGDLHNDNAIVINTELRRSLASLRGYETSARLPAARTRAADPQWRPVLSAAVQPTAIVQPGQGWAQFAGYAAGRPDAPYAVRMQWARELAAFNGTSVDQPLRAGKPYAVPWFDVVPKA